MQGYWNHKVIIVAVQRKAFAQTLYESVRQRLIASILVPPNYRRDNLTIFADSRTIARNCPRAAKIRRRFGTGATPIGTSVVRSLQRNSAHLAYRLGDTLNARDAGAAHSGDRIKAHSSPARGTSRWIDKIDQVAEHSAIMIRHQTAGRNPAPRHSRGAKFAELSNPSDIGTLNHRMSFVL